jgi:hypothetical protein
MVDVNVLATHSLGTTTVKGPIVERAAVLGFVVGDADAHAMRTAAQAKRFIAQL